MNSAKLHSLGILQMQREIETWMRVIDFLIAENIYLKNRLSEVIQNDVSVDILEQIENYQNNFITKDTMLSLLVKDIKEHRKTLEWEAADDKELGRVISIHNKLRDDVTKTEKEFTGLRANFNKFLMTIFR